MTPVSSTRLGPPFRGYRVLGSPHSGLRQQLEQAEAQVELAAGELRVRTAAQASPHRTAALAAHCQKLDAKAIVFSGTNLRLRLAVSPHELLT
jgi:hypothetical protein